MKKFNMNNIMIYFIFILLILPQSFEVLYPGSSLVFNLLKIVSFISIILYFAFNRIKFDKFIFIIVLYSVYILIVTFFHNTPAITFFKVYPFNIAAIFFVKTIFEKKDLKIISGFLHITNFLIITNFVIMCICLLINGSPSIDKNELFFLGADNRFILYFFLQMVLFNILITFNSNNNDEIHLLKRYKRVFLIDLISVFITWSASALVVLVLMYFSQFHLKKIKTKINYIYVYLIVGLMYILLIFFNIQNLFSFFIVDILKKSLTLSYRTNIWEMAFYRLSRSPLNLLFGMGFTDLTTVFKIPVYSSLGIKFFITPIHLHNLVVNCLYDGGIVGLCIYILFIRRVIIAVQKIREKNSVLYGNYSIIISAFLILMLFDVFEYYQAYFMILAFIYYTSKKGMIKNE